jgi:hypothetical protein
MIDGGKMNARKLAATAVALAAMMSIVVGGTAAHANPLNDDFANATVISSIPFVQTTDTSGAGNEPGEPDAHVCASVGASIWYSFVAPDNQKLTATTKASRISAVVGVFTGSALDDLQNIGCGDDVAFTPVAGTTYYFQVGDTEVADNGDWLPLAGIVTLDLDLYAPQPVCDGCPKFNIYQAPNALTNANNAGETSIGVGPHNEAEFLMSTTTAKVSFDDTKNPPTASWENASSPVTSKITFDPILFTDPATHRTFVAQDIAVAPAVASVPAPGGVGTSLMAYTDDGTTWIPIVPPVTESWDHQSVGGGPYPSPLPLGLNPLYPHAVYYCSQDGLLFAWCSRSDDGGLTWNPATPAGTPIAGCDYIHGHIQVAPNGYVYVPFRVCSGANGKRFQGFLVSKDAGLTWAPTTFAGIEQGHFDPALAFDSAGRGYYVANSGADGHPYVMVSDQNGENWSKPFDVGTAYHIRNSEFAMAAAGSPGRAAVAFYGTPTEGDDQTSDFEGAFHLYVSFTYDGGQTWKTQDLTPSDPVQRGCLWAGGGSNPCRNLLDFQGMTIDKQGRVLIGYADGCTKSTCVGPNGRAVNSRDSRGTIARQTTGKGLLETYDGLF